MLLLIGLGVATAPAAPADTGADVVVIYNAAMPESRQVAEHYAKRRQVPPSQVYGYDLPTTEAISRTEYLARLQAPLLKRLEADTLFTFTDRGEAGRQLTGATIRYLALCYGVPTTIQPDPTLIEPDGERLNPELRRNEAAVDSQLACLPVVEGKFVWVGPRPNLLYGSTNASQLHPTNGLLLVTRLDGPTPEIARGLVDKALAAEADGLWGRAYFDLGWSRDNTNYLEGDQWLGGAAALCRRIGFETVLDTNKGTFPATFPLSQTAFYAGWYAGAADGPFGWGGVEFMPGAFAYHLHSFSAAHVRSAHAHWVGPLLAQGATATMGSVYEPYLAATPDMNVFFWRFTYFGFSFGEAAWACQKVVSWQNLAVGDPLYRPFAKRPDQRGPDLERQGNPLMDWYVLMRINGGLVAGQSVDAAIRLLVRLPRTRHSALLQEKLGELYWDKKQLSNSLSAYAAALKLEPTPLQQLRLLLVQAERLSLYGRREQALAALEQVLKEYPQYPDKLAVYEKMLPLARRLEKTDLVERCDREIKRLTPPPTDATTTEQR